MGYEKHNQATTSQLDLESAENCWPIIIDVQQQNCWPIMANALGLFR